MSAATATAGISVAAPLPPVRRRHGRGALRLLAGMDTAVGRRIAACVAGNAMEIAPGTGAVRASEEQAMKDGDSAAVETRAGRKDPVDPGSACGERKELHLRHRGGQRTASLSLPGH